MSMWFSIINIILAIITVVLTYGNLKIMGRDLRDKKKFKIFIDSKFIIYDTKETSDIPENSYITLLLSNVGDNTLISADIEIPEEKKVRSDQRIGTLKPSHSFSFYFPIRDVLTKHLLSKENKTEYKVSFKLSYFNKYYNTYLNENKKLLVTIENQVMETDKVIIKTDNLYIESKKKKECRSE
ncbi:hypothetical protein [Staphylococcus nepalensis]|uniref:hypothetical protein n=2 Tax=Staphylococcus nepalensis TaxID=214473 RepID=UPI001C3EBCFA|nr:hypothetical protein [Staphylococcus nepalensis]